MASPAAAFDESFDVVVVGSGAAGCAAGASAAKAGARNVLICEASEKMVGGPTRLAGALFPVAAVSNPTDAGLLFTREGISGVCRRWMAVGSEQPLPQGPGRAAIQRGDYALADRPRISQGRGCCARRQ